MDKPLFFVADAHEGPVWVADQCRLYYTTTKHLDTGPRVDIEYLDFAGITVCGEEDLWDKIDENTPLRVVSRLFWHDARMANSMCLGEHGRSLIVAEQGDHDRPSVVARYNLADKSRSVVYEPVDAPPFNSINKVALTPSGHLLFSDPDYGFRQGFRPPPLREPFAYVYANNRAMHEFRGPLEMPHGMTTTPNETKIFITDTSNDGAHDDDVELKRRCAVYMFDFDKETGAISGDGIFCFNVDKGVPDGAITTDSELLVGGGDGVYVANLNGQLTGKIPTDYTAVNVALAGQGKHLFVTCDEGVLLFLDWREAVEPAGVGAS